MTSFDADAVNGTGGIGIANIPDAGSGISGRVLEMIPHAVVLIDDCQTIRYFNPAAESIFGYPRDGVIGQPLELLLPPAAVTAHPHHVREFFNGDREPRWMDERRPLEGRRSNGEIFPARAAILGIGSGDDALAVAIVEDLTGVRTRDRNLQRLTEVLENTPDFVGLADAEGNVTWHNAAARALLGMYDTPANYHVCQSHPEWAARRVLEEGFPAAVRDGTWRGQSAMLDTSGTEIPVDQVLIAHQDPSGQVDCISTIARDLRPVRSMYAENQRQERALEQAGDMIWITNADGVIEYVNPAFERMTGYPRSEAVGFHTASLLASGEHSRSFYKNLWRSLHEGRVFRAVFTNRTRSGQRIYMDETIAPVHDPDGNIEAFVATGRDVTERMQIEQQLRELASLDPLTRLPNRSEIQDRLARAIERARYGDCRLAVLFLDLDNFKDVNDAQGHPTGDQVLKTVASRVAGDLRRNDAIGRQGGDELLIVLEDMHDIEIIKRIADKVLYSVRQPIETENLHFSVRASIGIATWPESGDTPDELITAADTAMYQAKEAGGDRYAFHTHELNESVQERWFLLHALHDAEERGQLSVYLQPIVNAVDHSLSGAEILLRWKHDVRGWIEPDRFIPIAEETGRIREIGMAALREACRHAAAWRAAGLEVPSISVNTSSIQLGTPDFPDRVMDALAEAGLPPQALVIEMTETTFMVDDRITATVLERLRAQGIGIAIDDFGTGYSSLGYLKKFPADSIKLDREFVRMEEHRSANIPIIESVVALGRAFGSRVVAEGIEREEEAAVARDLGVQQLQGFLFGFPMEPDVFRQIWLQE